MLSPFPLRVGAGGEQDLLRLAEDFSGAGWSLTIACINNMFHNEPRLPQRILNEIGDKVYLVDLPVSAAFSRILPIPSVRGLQQLRGLVISSDVVFLNTFYVLDALVILLARMLGAQPVISIANPVRRFNGTTIWAKLTSIYNSRIAPFIWKRASLVRVWNNEDYSFLFCKGFRNLIVLPPSSQLGEALTGGTDETSAMEIIAKVRRDSRFKILIAGRMTSQKGIDVVEAIMSCLANRLGNPSSKFCFYFAGTATLPHSVHRICQTCPNLIENIGLVPRPLLQDLMREFDLLLMPSRYESFGLAALEAQSVGVPVLGSNISGLRDIIIHGKTGLLIGSWEPDEYARAILAYENQKRSDLPGWVELRQRVEREYDRRFGPAIYKERVSDFISSVERIVRDGERSAQRA